MEIIEKIDLEDCPFCGGAGLLDKTCDRFWTVMCMDCGSQTAEFEFKTPELSEEAARQAAKVWNMGKVLRMGVGDQISLQIFC